MAEKRKKRPHPFLFLKISDPYPRFLKIINAHESVASTPSTFLKKLPNIDASKKVASRRERAVPHP